KLHRDTSFGSNSGPLPPPIGGSHHNRDSSFGSGGPPRGGFRDGPPFRDRDGGHHGRDGGGGPPPFRRGDGPMRDDFPRGPDREMGPDVGIDRTRSSDSARESPFVPGGLQRETSFGQGRPGFAPRGPEGRDVPGHIHPHNNRPGLNIMNSPNPAGPPQPSRPTDPRRRASSNDVGALAAGQGGIGASMSGELSSPRRHSYNDGPAGLGPTSPSQPRRLNSYGSFGQAAAAGGDAVLPRPGGGGFRSPGSGMRRASSETGFQGERKEFGATGPPPNPWTAGDRSRSAPIAGKNENSMGHSPAGARPVHHERQYSTGSVPAASGTHMSDARFHGPREEKHPGSLPTVPEASSNNDAASLSATDPFGRTRDWAQKPQGVAARSGSGGFKHGSPSGVKPTKSPLSSPSGERSMLSAPKFPLSSGNDASEKEPAKAKLPPIPISALGSADMIQRAEVVITHFNEVTTKSSTTPNAAGKLPSKADIMAAVSTIEKMIKETKTESEENEEAVRAAKKIEKEKLEEAEKKRRLELEKKLEEKRQEEEKMKAEVDTQTEIETEIRFEAKRKELEMNFGGQLLKAKEVEKLRCSDELEARMKEASTGLEKSVVKARRDLERSKNTAQKIGKKLAASETEYKKLAESEEKKRKKRKKAPKKDSVQIEDVVRTITESNQRKAKESHMFTLSVAETGMHLECHDDESAAVQKLLEEKKDPKYGKSFEEWSIMAGQVTGLSNALYSEPSETPYFQQIEKNHEVLGPLVKEFIRDKNKRLDKHWMELATEYEVRKRLYEKQQRKLAKKSKGSVAVTSRPSIIGINKEKKEKKEEKPAEPAARSSNNPYRRARRGNEVRS
ncbi:MAG: hypothetical protein SGARI_001027, partial [Bacillariaceae sp.]